MSYFIELHTELLQHLNEAGVDYIIVGGYAVNYYGYHRTTDDLDIWLKPDNANKQKLITALKAMLFDEDDIYHLNTIDFTRHQTFSIGDLPAKADFLTYISGVDYETADAQKIIHNANNVLIPFIHINHLVLSKMSSERLKDKADVEGLQQSQKRK